VSVIEGMNYYFNNKQLPVKERVGFSTALMIAGAAAYISYFADVLIESTEDSYRGLKKILKI